MCELTCEEILKSDGYSLQDFLAWKASRTKVRPKKKSRKEWLAQFKDCEHCQFDGICRKQRLGYSQKYRTEGYINRMKNGVGLKDCCIWSGDVANSLHDKADKLVKEGVLHD